MTESDDSARQGNVPTAARDQESRPESVYEPRPSDLAHTKAQVQTLRASLAEQYGIVDGIGRACCEVNDAETAQNDLIALQTLESHLAGKLTSSARSSRIGRQDDSLLHQLSKRRGIRA